MPAPPKTKLNKYNIIDVQRSLLKTYQTKNNDLSDPCCQLDNCCIWSSKWCNITLGKQNQQHFLMSCVRRWWYLQSTLLDEKRFWRFECLIEILPDELVMEISSIKTVSDNAILKLQDALKVYKGLSQQNPHRNIRGSTCNLEVL